MVDIQMLYIQALKSFVLDIRRGKIFFLFSLFAFLLTQQIVAQTTAVYNTAGTYTFIIPSDVTSITVTCWGGGGAGASVTSTTKGGGGGGGACVQATISVTPGAAYTVTVGGGGTSATPTNGGDSWFGSSSTVLAKGGASVATNGTNGGAGGSASSCIPSASAFNGGDGAGSNGTYSGGGGGSAGTTGAGGNGGTPNAGTAGTAGTGGGAAGGTGLSSNGYGIAGVFPGAGGSGAYRKNGSSSYTGGSGADGKVTITFTSNLKPGGVTGASLWLRSDWGTSSNTDATALGSWANNVDGVNLTQATSGNQPLFRTGSSASSPASPFNFNPAISFDGSSDYFKGASNYGINGSSVSFTTLAVGRTKDNTKVNAIWGGENATTGNTTFQIFNGTDGNFPNDAAIDQWDFFPLAGGATGHTANDPFLAEEAISSSSADSYNNGVKDNNGNNTRKGYGTSGTSYPTNTIVDIGARPTSSNPLYFYGDIAEVLIFTRILTELETQQVNSYLGIKYGFTLDKGVPSTPYAATIDYIASDGSTVYWSTSTNSGYNYNIAGIARDDVSSLYQKQSKTTNKTLAVVIGNGSTISSDNASNTSVISADKSALLWGDNNGSVSSWTTTGIPTDFQIGGNSLSILARTWKVQKTGTIGTVRVQVPDNRSSLSNKLPAVSISGSTNSYPNYNVYLLVDGDGNFTAGAKAIKMKYNATTMNWEVNYNFNSTYPYFTFAKGPRFIESNKFLSSKPYATW